MKKVFLFLMIGLVLLVVACSNDSSDSSNDGGGVVHERSSQKNEGYDYSSSDEQAYDGEVESGYEDDRDSIVNELDIPVERKIIYTADLSIEVKDFQQSLQQIQNNIADFGGYIVESRMDRGEGDAMTHGSITARIPQEQFQSFIKIVEDGSYKVLDSTTSGQDVTEEFVDLESRLKSKRVVEERLLSFMEQADKTEDLLKISNDLARVQEEIEGIMGRKKYLENRADLATVTIHMQENNVSLTTMSDKDLDTWERTKQQFVKSVNTLLTFFSGLFVFLVGNLPVILLFGVIGLSILLIVKKRKNGNQTED